jgi:hypothetical protein
MMPMMFPFGGMAFAGLGVLVLAIVVVAVLVAVWPGMSSQQSAEEVLRQRYARGEIDADEYGSGSPPYGRAGRGHEHRHRPAGQYRRIADQPRQYR